MLTLQLYSYVNTHLCIYIQGIYCYLLLTTSLLASISKASKALRMYFFRQLITHSDGVLHEHLIFSYFT